ncbi:MAG: aminotransferase class III-fold pyridoxal phosphate-dependent enzyme [Bacteriovoracaceae bacterium]|nr:aminotransferase class III-fold pyridoxal phosphate-dependent enzyme [Bacteriovoracaceae bacterium]
MGAKKSKSDLMEWFSRIVSSLANLHIDKVDIRTPFLQLGMSSMDVVQVIQDYQKWSGSELSPTLFFEYSTIEELATYLSSEAAVEKTIEYNTSEVNSSEPIAIIGLSCRFPGGKNPNDFWQLLKEGRSAIRKIPAERFTKQLSFDAYAGLIDDVAAFDAQHFGVSATEAVHLDPQQRLLMELSWEALENAGYAPSSLSGSKTGVFVGISSSDYSLEKARAYEDAHLYDGTGMAHSIAANRISYFYNFKGPSFALDTACSSSLLAIHEACESLRTHQSQMALAGGVNLILSHYLMEAFRRANMLSPDGSCKTFDKNANGYVRAEGGGFLVLKRLSDALKSGDKILAMVAGSAVNQDGKTNTLTAPNGAAQVDVIKSALSKAQVKPSDIQYVEAHGTGTNLGDPVEYAALKKVFQDQAKNVYLGSVKTNIGHSEAAAGIAGVIKTVLSLQNEMIPAHLNFQTLNPSIDEKNSPLKVLTKPVTWKRMSNKTRYASVSSFGFGGTNSHVVLQEAPATSNQLKNFATETAPSHQLFTLSAASPEALAKTAQEYSNYLEKNPTLDLVTLCSNVISQRANLSARLAFVTKSLSELKESLKNSTFMTGYSTTTKQQKVAFVFTGQGSNYAKMGLELYEHNHIYRQKFNYCLKKFGETFKKDMFAIWDEGTKRTDYGQALIFSLECALLDLVSALGIKADFVLGHSLGEITAAYHAGILNCDDAIALVAARGSAMQNTADGRMLIVFAERATVNTILGDYPNEIALAAINGPQSFVLSGQTGTILKISAQLTEQAVKNLLLPVEHAFHSQLMQPALTPFRTAIENLKFSAPTLKLISCVNAELMTETTTADYWVSHIEKTTNFMGAAQKLAEFAPHYILEIGPHPTLIPMLSRFYPSKECKMLNFLQQKETDSKIALQTLAKLYTQNMDLNLSTIMYHGEKNKYQLPQTQYEKKNYWFGVSTNSIQPEKKKMKPQRNVLNELKAILAQEIGFDPQTVNEKEALINLGADSLVMLNCLETINEKYNVEINVNDLFQNLSTLESIANFINNSAPVEEEAPVATAAPLMNVTRSSVNVSGDFFEQQISIIQQQLDLLRNMKGAAPIATVNKVAAKPAVSASATATTGSDLSGRGVLGNFSGKHVATTEKLEDDQKQAYLNKLIKTFSERTKKSKELTQKYRTELADNRAAAGFRPNLKEVIYPIVCEKAQGSRFVDIDGNNYVDFTMGFGVNLFGHSPDFINKALKAQLDTGLAVGPQSNQAGQVAALMAELTKQERVAFVNSGTEAIMTAVRLARAATKREKIVIFEGSYHGHFDGILGRRTTKGDIVPVAPGVPRSLTEDLIVLDYTKQESLDYIQQHGQEIAAVLVESVQSRYPEYQPKEFLKEIRRITESTGTAMVFDEVITGFRIAVGGAQEHFGIKADIAAYGKVMGGGMPIGAVAGSKKYMDFIDGGEWRFGDQSIPQNNLTFFAGTFCKHPLAMAASYEALSKLKNEGKELIEKLNNRTTAMVKRLNDFFTEKAIGLELVSFGSLFRFKFQSNMDWLFIALNLEGVYIWEGRNMFLSTAHTDADVDFFVNKVQKVVNELIDVGYITSQKPQVLEKNMIESHERFLSLVKSEVKENRLSAQIYLALTLKGNLNEPKMIEALSYLLKRYDSLNAKYKTDEKKILFNQPNTTTVGLIDFSELPDAANRAQQWLENNSKNELKINEEPLKIDLLKISNEDYLISFVTQHLVMDGLSIAFMTDDLAKVYTAFATGKELKLNNVSSFGQYLEEFNPRIAKMDEAAVFWKTEAQNWTGLPMKQMTDNKAGKRLKLHFDKDGYNKIKLFGYKNKSSLLVTLLSVFYKNLEETFSQKTFTVGIPAAGHTSIKEPMIGNCVNLAPLTYTVGSAASLIEQVQNLRQYQLEVFKHADYPYLRVISDQKSSPLAIIFNVEPISKLPKFDTLTADLLTYPIVSSEFPLMINAMKLNDELHIEMDFQYALFSDAEAAKFLNSYKEKLSQIDL